MSKLSDSELKARRKRMQQEALKSVAKTSQLNIRIDEDCIMRLYALAAQEERPVGTMVREWIVDRLKFEEEGGETAQLQVLIDSIASLHTRLDRIDQIEPKPRAGRQLNRKSNAKSR